MHLIGYQMLDDKKTIERFKEGDVAAFDTIYRKYSRKLFHFALGLVKEREMSRDIVQEVFINLWEKRSKVDLNLNFDNYIFTIAYNSILKFFRKRAVETRLKEQMLVNSPEVLESVEGNVIYYELLELANNSIENLPPMRKMVYKLNRQEGMKIKEIARKLNISKRTAENHLARALKHLKEELSWMSVPAIIFVLLFIQ